MRAAPVSAQKPMDAAIKHLRRALSRYLDTIDNSIRVRDKLQLIFSKHSIKRESVETEVTTAFEEERKRQATRALSDPP